MNNTGKVVVAAAAGLAVGALAGILFAPASGKETRAKIAGKAAELKDKALGAAKGAKETVESAAKEAAATAKNGQA